jgi:hypothetical protein
LLIAPVELQHILRDPMIANLVIVDHPYNVESDRLPVAQAVPAAACISDRSGRWQDRVMATIDMTREGGAN